MLEKLWNSLHQKVNHSSTEREYIKYTQELDYVLTNLEALLHESNDPEEIVRHALATACEFYGGDWAGFLDVDLDLSLWTPYMWYNTNPNDKTLEFLSEFESSDFLYRWVRALKENQPVIVQDCNDVRESYPHEYALYQHLHMKSVIAVSVKPFPTGFLVVRNPTRYVKRSSMLQMLAFVVIKGVSEKQLIDGAKMAWSPEDIRNDRDIIINLFGELEIYTSKGVLRENDLKSPKISRLLAFLLLHPKRTYPARELAEILWQDEASDQDNPGQNMKYLIFRLRQRFDMISEYRLIETAPGGYCLNQQLNIMTDLQQFDRYKEAANSTSSITRKVEFLKKALALYKGSLLSSATGDHWLMPSSTHYHLEYLGAANELLKTLADLRDYADIHIYATQVLNHEPGNVSAHFWLIFAAHRQGSTETAKLALKEAEQLLTTEEYKELVEQLRRLKDVPFDFRATRRIF